MNIYRSLIHVPMHPKEWRQRLKRLMEVNKLTINQMADNLQITIEELQERLIEDPEKDELQYDKGLQKCIKANEEYFSLEDMSRILDIPVSRLLKCKHLTGE